MKDIVNPMEASHIVDRSDKRLRQVLRILKHANLLEPGTAWQEPDQPNGNWFIAPEACSMKTLMALAPRRIDLRIQGLTSMMALR